MCGGSKHIFGPIFSFVQEKRSIRSLIVGFLRGDLQIMMLGNAFESGLRFFAFVIYAKALGPADVGVVAGVLALTQLLIQVTQFGIDTSVISLASKEVARGALDRSAALCRSGLWLHLLFGGALAVLGITLAPMIAGRYFDNPDLKITLIVAFAGSLLFRLAAYVLSVLRTHQRFAHYAAAGLASAIFLFGGVIWLYARDELTILTVTALVMVGTPATKILVGLFGMPGAVLRLHRPGAPFREILSFGKWVWGTGVLEAAVRRVNILLLLAFAGEVATGHFAMATRFAEFLQLVFEPVRKYLLPKFTALGDLPSIARALRTTYARLIWTLLILPPAWLLAKPVILAIEGAEWEGAVLLFQILVVARLLFLLSKPLAFVTFALKRPQVQTMVHLVGLVLFTAAAVPLIPRYGAVGSAICMLWFSVVILSAFIWYTRHVLRSEPAPSRVPGDG